MDSHSFRKVVLGTMVANSMIGIDFVAEANLIVEKKSRLSKSRRDVVEKVTAMATASSNSMETEMRMASALSAFSGYPFANIEMSKKDTIKQMVAKMVSQAGDFSKENGLDYVTSSPVDCLSVAIAYFKIFGKMIEDPIGEIVSMSVDDMARLYDRSVKVYRQIVNDCGESIERFI